MQIPSLELLSMATAVMHDRLGKGKLRARRVYWHHHRPYLPMWATWERGVLTGVHARPLQTAMFWRDVMWTHNRARWEFRFDSAHSRVFTPSGTVGDEGGARSLALSRQDVAGYGELLEMHGGLIEFYEHWLIKRGVPEDEASRMTLKAFTDAMDRIVYLPGVKIYQVAFGLMRQRLLNQIRDRKSQGTLIQSRRDLDIGNMENDLVSRDIENPIVNASRVARQFADLILGGETMESAIETMKLTSAELAAIKAEIANELGFFELCEEENLQ